MRKGLGSLGPGQGWEDGVGGRGGMVEAGHQVHCEGQVKALKGFGVLLDGIRKEYNGSAG